MISIGDYNKIMSDRNIFNQIVYTPLSEALRLLDERQKDPVLIAKVEKLLKGDIPEVLKNNNKCAVLFRQIATPNHEGQYFYSLAKEYNLTPVFFEYFDDKFTSNNEYKHSLGQLRIQKKFDCNGCDCSEKITIIDFAKYDGKKLKSVQTIWGESLIDFHSKLFKLDGYNIDNLNFYDASSWIKNNGGKAINYYINFFLLMTCYGILFESFLLNDTEKDFTKNVILSAIEKVFNMTGVKPLIVPAGPIEIEADEYWFSYNTQIKKYLLSK